ARAGKSDFKSRRNFEIGSALFFLILASASGARSAVLVPVVVGLAAFFQNSGKKGLATLLISIPVILFVGIFMEAYRKG
ncbi:hypothetical protein R0J90_22925, partial [Micrococcus sp. SIMBA_144]